MKAENSVTRARGHQQGLQPKPTPWSRRRVEAGLSLTELAARTGLNKGTLSRIDSSYYPSPEQARAILAAFDAASAAEEAAPTD